MAEARCPASCGELLQGWILGGERLISCPIDWFSYVCINEGKPLRSERPRMRQMLKSVLHYLDYPATLAAQLQIDFYSSIPVGKGLASSTADIAATAQATARFLGHELRHQELAKLCVAIEPTDSTIFNDLTLFDHRKGDVLHTFTHFPKVEILLLESPEVVLTQDYHKLDREHYLLANQTQLMQAWQLMQTACDTQDPRRLGEATTLSAAASQSLLAKPHFEQFMRLIDETGIYGLNVAHSGSVVGLLYDSLHHDRDHLLWWLQAHNITQAYPTIHQVTMINGGVH